MKTIEFKLESGKLASFFLTNNFVVCVDSKNYVSICDGVHNNGGWKLHESHTYDEVMKKIKDYN
jgi:hypothetical protein